MRFLLFLAAPVALFFAVGQLTGCTDPAAQVSAKLVAQHQGRLILEEEPEDGLQTVADVRAELMGVVEEPHDHEHAHDEDVDHAHEHEHEKHDEGDHEHEHGDDADHDHEHHAHDEDGDHAHEHDDHEGHDHDDHDHASSPSEPMEVVMVGTVGGLTNPWAEMQPEYPFAENQAMLFVCDSGTVAEQEASGHVHALGEECAFCARHAGETKDMIAMVRFLGEEGKVLPVAAQQLFDVEPMDTVVIKGTAHVNEGGLLIVDAYGIYVRK